MIRMPWTRLAVFVIFISPSVLRADLVAHWPLNEGSGTVFNERVSGANGFLPTGSIPMWTNDAAPTTFANPYALEFGGDGFVDTLYEGIGGEAPRTISAWVKTDSTAGQAIVAYGARDGDGRKWHFRVNPDGAPRVPGAIRTEAQGGNQTGDTNIADGQWHHVVSVFPGELPDNLEVLHYVDGVLEGETGTTDEFIDTGVGDGFPLVTIGARQQSPPAYENFMNGFIDDVRIYDRALTDAEIVALGSSPTSNGLVAHWPFDDGPGSNQATELIADHHGTLTSELQEVSVEWANDGPPGIQDTSVEFTGDLGPSFIETPFEGITGDGARTITLWMKADPQPGNTAMVAWGGLATGEKWHFRLEQSNNALRTEFSGGQNFADTDLADGEWHFVASVLPEGGEGQDVMHYLDAELEVQAGGTSVPIDTASLADGAFPVHLGWAAGHANRWFAGQMADVRIYDEALDEDALREIMMGGGVASPGDYNRDGLVDVFDIDLQANAMNDANPDLNTFDENGDGQVNTVDRFIWVHDHAGTWVGDSNLDGEFNSSDLVLVFASGKYNTREMAGWAEGDWNGDLEFQSGDLVAAFSDGGYEMGPRLAAHAVPEPSGVWLALLGMLAVLGRRAGGRIRIT